STAEGLVPIRELAERGSADIVVAARASGGANGLLQLGTLRARAVRVWKTGVKPVWRLATRAGLSIKATRDHRFLTPKGWRPLGSLALGDRVLTQMDPFEDEIVAIEHLGEEDVYDLEEPMTHSFLGNGLLLHNCGEQPLLPYES